MFPIKLQNKIILLCSVFFVAFTLIFYFMSYQRSIDILDRQADDNAASALEQVKLHVSYILSEMDTISNIIANQHDVNELLYNSLHETDRIKQIENYFGLKPVLNDILNSYSSYGITIYLPKDVLFTQEKVMINPQEDIDTPALYSSILDKNGGAVWSSNLRLTASLDQNVISQYKLLKHYYTNNVIGLIEVYAPSRLLKDILNTVRSGADSVTYMIEPRGTVVASNAADQNAQKPDAELLQGVLRGGLKGSIVVGRGRDSKLVVYRKLEINDWILVTSIPEATLYASSKKVRDSNLMTIMAVLLIVIGLIYFILKSSTKRINRLVRVMSHIEGDGLKTVIPNKFNDEIGELEKRFNGMRLEINNLIAEIYRAEHKKKEAQFVALQAQINPHFLYNTLDTINWMAINQNAYDVSSIITALSKFFRLTLNAGNEIITLKDEIEIVKQYLSIQKLRYDDDLKIEYCVDESVMDCDTVKLTLQPIVENALKHGIQPSGRPGEIRIEARMTRDRFIQLRVSDNGVGLHKQGAVSEGNFMDRTGYGLKNVLERLVLHFGSGCSLDIEDGAETGAQVCLQWPARQQET